MFFHLTYTLTRPARPPKAAHRLGPARTHRTADDPDRDHAAVPAGGRLEGEQLAVVQPGPRLTRRVDRAELELPAPDADAPGAVRRHGSRPEPQAGGWPAAIQRRLPRSKVRRYSACRRPAFAKPVPFLAAARRSTVRSRSAWSSSALAIRASSLARVRRR